MDENFFITQKEIDFVDKIKGVKHISGMYFRAGEISFRDQRKYRFVIGIDAKANRDFLEETFTVGIGKEDILKEESCLR